MKFAKLFVVALLVGAMPAMAAEYEIDPVHSNALFKVNHLGASNVYGAITDLSGTIIFDPATPANCSVQMTVKPETVNTFNQGRDTHLKGPDFFNAKQFPEITFKSTKWEAAGEGKFKVTGDFTMRGVTKSITVDVMHVGVGKDRRGKELTGFETQFTIDRTEYGMNYGVAESGGLGKDVTIIISVESGKKA